jgi:hypothetical protein
VESGSAKKKTWRPNGVQTSHRYLFCFQWKCLYLVDLTALKRLAAAVRFRPWPPFKINHLQRWFFSLSGPLANIMVCKLLKTLIISSEADESRKKAGVASSPLLRPAPAMIYNRL